MEPNLEKYPGRGVICDSCAKLRGGVWPKGHLGTFYEDICMVCRQVKVCTETRDYLWGMECDE